MGITLANFQLKAIEALMEAMGEPNRDIILKSCTGSGKTIILTHFMDEYLKSTNKAVFVWLTPGKGNLELQSKAKMDKYIHGSNTKLLSDIMSSGFEENDACFINWEKLTKKGNNALKDSERTNFVEHIQNAIDNGLTFTIIVDESHQNDTIKADDILALFNANKIIRCSATPKNYKNALLIEIPEEDVIAEGLIKKLLIINENFEQHISVEDQISYLLDKALEKQRNLRAAYAKKDSGVNPLIIVQLPNKSDALLDRVEEYFESKGITYENNLLSVWLSDKKQNLEDIEDNDATPIAVIIKQAVATGWDCPRAQILVKLRDNMSEVFEIQTIGRIRRMPEAKHYGEDLLDCCYLYTLDEKFTESVKLSLGTGALDAYKVFLKPEYRSFTLISQFKTDIPFPRDAKFALKVIWKFFEKKYHTATDLDKNQSQLLPIMEARDLLKPSGLYYESYLNNFGRQLFYVISGSYTTLYMGFMFLIIACALLALQFLTQMQTTKSRYLTLSILGARREQIKRSINQQVLWYFLLPLILACISGAVGIYAMQLYLYSGAAHLEQSYPLLIAMAVIVVLVMVIYGVAVARTANREIGKLNYKPNS